MSNSLRVLHIHSGNLYGGGETVLNTLVRCRALSPAMEHHFALCFDGLLSSELARRAFSDIVLLFGHKSGSGIRKPNS